MQSTAAQSIEIN